MATTVMRSDLDPGDMSPLRDPRTCDEADGFWYCAATTAMEAVLLAMACVILASVASKAWRVGVHSYFFGTAGLGVIERFSSLLCCVTLLAAFAVLRWAPCYEGLARVLLSVSSALAYVYTSWYLLAFRLTG